MAHKNLIRRAAYAAKLNSLCPDFLRLFQYFGILRGKHNQLGNNRLVAVNDNIHVIFFQNSQIRPAAKRDRSSEKNILQISGNHRAAPAIAKRTARSLEHDILVILVDTHMRSMHDFNNFPVDCPRPYSQFIPQLISRLRRDVRGKLISVRFSKFVERLLADLKGNRIYVVFLFRILAFRAHLHVFGYMPQFLAVLDSVTLGFPFGGHYQRFRHITTVVGVSGRPRSYHTNEISCRNGVRIRTTHASRRFFGDSARTHVANSATDTLRSELARFALGLIPVPA
jgi:hypothetical protein